MNSKTYSILYFNISMYKKNYCNNKSFKERHTQYESRILDSIKNASIIGSITHEEAIALYHHAFN